MNIDFDPAKNKKNIQTRGLSFEDVGSLKWEETVIRIDNREDYREERLMAFVPDRNSVFYVVVFTMRKDVFRIISFRKANERERRFYHAEKARS